MSTQLSSIEAMPHEMWLRIFGLVDSSATLASVVLVCRKFHMLASEALVRNIHWRSSVVARKHMEFWERNPSKCHLVRSLSLSLHAYDAEDDMCIFGCIQSFSKLTQLKFSWGQLPDIVYHTLQYLPTVTELTLEGCVVLSPPVFFPFTYPSPGPPPEIAVTTLKISKLKLSPGSFFEAVTVPIAFHLPHLHTFASDTMGIQIPTSASARITSLTLTLGSTAGDIQPRLDVLLHRMPALTHLAIAVALVGPAHAAPGTAAAVSPQPAVPLASLRVISAPWPALGHITLGAPALEHLRVTTAIGKPADAVWLLERLRGAPVRSAALRVHVWDDEVLLAAARCLPACEALEVSYQDGGPDDGFLFNLGIHHLPLMRGLHTLRLLALPPVADPAPLRFVWDPAPTPMPMMLGMGGPAAPPYIAGPAPHVPLYPGSSPPAPFYFGSSPPNEEMEQASDGEEDSDGKDDDEEDGGAEDDREEDEEGDEERVATAALLENVHAWARYNPALRRVQLGTEPGRAWVKRVEAGVSQLADVGVSRRVSAGRVIWDVDEAGEDERADIWAALMSDTEV